MLWKDICQNQLLAKTTLILFLNKVRFSVLPLLAPSVCPRFCARRSGGAEETVFGDVR